MLSIHFSDSLINGELRQLNRDNTTKGSYPTKMKVWVTLSEKGAHPTEMLAESVKYVLKEGRYSY